MLKTQYLETEGGRIAYDDTGGNGALLIAIPGMDDLRAEYRYLRPVLAAAGYRVVTMDIRGGGESSVQWFDFSARAVGRDALALIKHLGAEGAFILGNSFAAGSALWAAQAAPAQIYGVVLLGPIVRDAPPSLLMETALKLGFAGPWRVWFWMTYWDSLFPLRKPDDHAAYRALLDKNMREAGRMDALEKMVRLSKAETAAMVGLKPVPALIVMGSKDPDFKDATAEAAWLAQKLSAQRIVVEGAGHYPHVETPQQIAPALVAFIGQHAVRAGLP